jgi:hypothetical protein
MNFAIKINEYNINNIFFNEQTKNNVDTNFIRFIYSSNLYSLNGISLLFEIKNLKYDRLFNHKYKYLFNTHENIEIINFIKNMEYDIISQFSSHSFHLHKHPQFKLTDQFTKGELKFIKNEENNNIYSFFIIKISGIWSSNDFYGLTYKILPINHQ